MANEVPSVISRSPGLIDLAIPVEPGVQRYRIQGHRTLDDAYGPTYGVGGLGPIDILDAEAQSFFRSPSVRNMRPARVVEESYRNQTRIQFDIMDYQSVANLLPNDKQALFLRMQKFHVATGAYLASGPILLVQPPGFFNTRFPSFTCAGSAPGVKAVAGSVLPIGAMHLMFTASVGEITIENLNPATSLMVSFNKDMVAMEIAGMFSITHKGGFNEILFASPLDGVATSFSFVAHLTNAG